MLQSAREDGNQCYGIPRG